jgi:hypothetical protein
MKTQQHHDECEDAQPSVVISNNLYATTTIARVLLRSTFFSHVASTIT